MFSRPSPRNFLSSPFSLCCSLSLGQPPPTKQCSREAWKAVSDSFLCLLESLRPFKNNLELSRTILNIILFIKSLIRWNPFLLLSSRCASVHLLCFSQLYKCFCNSLILAHICAWTFFEDEDLVSIPFPLQDCARGAALGYNWTEQLTALSSDSVNTGAASIHYNSCF